MSVVPDIRLDARLDVRLAVARLDAWLDTMRGPDGYTGPVSHWWQNCLFYTGPGLDWRYEGVMHGYLTLFERTGEAVWLAKARRAGNDLRAGQLASGHFQSSCFELNPYTGGTPHEAACDLALLMLAETLERLGHTDWRTYRETAERNIRAAQLGRLWDAVAGVLRDDPVTPTFVPNKAATLAEAILALARVSVDGIILIERYALPILDHIRGHQIQDGPLRGGIWQNTYKSEHVEKLFPFYVARCVPALAEGYKASGDERYLASAIEAMDFVLRFRDADGGFPQVVYPDSTRNTYPRWIAGAADVLRAIETLRPHGYDADLEPTLSWLLAAQSPSGAFPTAEGFSAQTARGQVNAMPSFRDLLPVVGWNDKVFRFLTSLLPDGVQLPSVSSAPYQTLCAYEKAAGTWFETPGRLELRVKNAVVYRWEKGTPWASVAAPELAWK
ncbi:MAG: pectate lyase [Chloroflexota bacterium]